MRTVFLLALAVLLPNAWAESPQGDKAAAIKRLIEVSGVRRNFDPVKNAIAVQMKPMIRQLVTVALEKDKGEKKENADAAVDYLMNEIFAGLSVDALVDRLVPIYDRYLSTEEVRSLIAYFESPIGKKMVELQPKISSEAFAVGAEWGGGVARSVIADPKVRAQVEAILRGEASTAPR